MTPTAHTHFSGSPCIVELTPGALGAGSNGAYIDAHQCPGKDLHRIELVVAGFVRRRWYETTNDTPERIVSIMKEFAR